MRWYYSIEGRAHGPVAEERLAELVAQKVVGGDTLIWQPGLKQWDPMWKLRPDVVGHLSKTVLAQKARGSTDRIPLKVMGDPHALMRAKLGTLPDPVPASAPAPAPTPEPPAPEAPKGVLGKLFGRFRKK